MPSLLHEILVALFRDRPALAGELLRASAGIDLGGEIAELGSIDLSQAASPEYRADAVVVLRDAARHATAAVIVEIQLGVDADKRFSWPLYVAALRASLRCPVVLLVLATSDRVARWARERIEPGSLDGRRSLPCSRRSPIPRSRWRRPRSGRSPSSERTRRGYTWTSS